MLQIKKAEGSAKRRHPLPASAEAQVPRQAMASEAPVPGPRVLFARRGRSCARNRVSPSHPDGSRRIGRWKATPRVLCPGCVPEMRCQIADGRQASKLWMLLHLPSTNPHLEGFQLWAKEIEVTLADRSLRGWPVLSRQREIPVDSHQEYVLREVKSRKNTVHPAVHGCCAG